MAQPIKKTVSYEKNISNELWNLLDNGVNDVIRNMFPSTKISPEAFFIAALSEPDCMLYKALNGYLTSIQIEEVYDSLYKNFSEVQGITTARANVLIDFSIEMRTLLSDSDKQREKMNFKTITSDILLLTLLHSQYDEKSPLNKLSNLLNEMGVSYGVYNDLVAKLHDTTNAIENISDDDNGIDEEVKALTIVISGGTNTIDTSEKKDLSGNVPYCINLNAKAERKEIDPIIGRKKEINSIINIFARRKTNNVLLVGESGVGKTAIIEGLAVLINNGTAPEYIKNAEIFKFNPSSVMSGTQYRGMFEERMLQITKALSKKLNVIFFLDDIHKIVSEKQEYNYDFSSALEEIFSNPNIRVVATTTQKGFHSSIENNPELARRFQKLTIGKPSISECKKIIERVKDYYEKFHGVKYDDNAISACVSLADRYITDRTLPTSAIDIIDEAGAKKKIGKFDNERLSELKNGLAIYKEEKSNLIKDDKIGDANICEAKIKGLKIEISGELEKLADNKEIPIVTETDIYNTVSEHTGIPVQKINASEKKALAKIDKILKRDIIGQDEAIDVVSRAIKRNKVGLYPSNRPIFSCMCIGNTGCGKTLLAKKLAKEIFGDEKYLIRFDMSEYSDKTSINKLIGASAGYVGYNEGGLLTEKVKNNKHAVVLFDEIEKADDEIYNLFLQILDEGFLTDNTGQKVDFKNTILILTSNIGTKKASTEKAIGFNVDQDINKKDIIKKELMKKFAPEFINRLDEIVYFNNLTEENLKDIIRLELDKLKERTDNIGFKYSYSNDVIDYVFETIKSERDYGARPILRAIQKEIENKITDIILDNDIETGEIDSFIDKENKLIIKLK